MVRKNFVSLTKNNSSVFEVDWVPLIDVFYCSAVHNFLETFSLIKSRAWLKADSLASLIHACPGISFGLIQMVHLTLASLIHAFDIPSSIKRSSWSYDCNLWINKRQIHATWGRRQTSIATKSLWIFFFFFFFYVILMNKLILYYCSLMFSF